MSVLDPPALPRTLAYGSPYRLNFAATNFRTWTKALVDVRNGVADARLLCVGDSTTTGSRSSTDATVPQNKSWPAQLAAAMNTVMVPTAKGLATPKSASAAQSADTRWTAGANWVLAAAGLTYLGFGGKGMYWQGFGATATNLVFADPTITADTFDIYYVLNPGGASTGSFTATASGGSPTTVNANAAGTKGIAKATVTAASASTGNTVTLANSADSRSVYIVGIEPYLSSVKKVRVGNAGAAGADTTTWVTEYSSNPWGGPDSIKAYAPHLSIIDLGINDAGNSITTTAYLANMQQLITAAQVSGDVVLKTMLPSSTTSGRLALEAQYATILRGLGLPLIDTFGRVGDWQTYYNQGYMNSDGIHGNDYSYGDVAGTVLAALQAI